MLVLLIALLVIFGSALPTAAAPEDLGAVALRQVSQQQGIPLDQLSLAESASASFPLTRVNLAEYKIVARDGRSFAVSFDAASRQVIDPAALAKREQQARLTAHGKLEPKLSDHLKRNAAAPVLVAVWVAMEDPGALARGDVGRLDLLAARVQQAQASALDAARALGATPERADLAPVFFAQLTAAQIKALEQRPDVVAIDIVPQNLQRFSDDDGATSDRYPFIWNVANGNGARVAVHEDDGIDTTNTYLVDPVYWCTGFNTGPGGTQCNIGTNVDSHATNVAGVIASTNQWRRGGAWGIAPGALLSANFQSFASPTKIVNSASWATANADVVNMSWGGCDGVGGHNFYSRWADYLARATGDPIVISSGNSNCGSPDFVGYPSLGWNTVSVGSYYDNNDGILTGDVLSSFTSWKNPTDPNSGRKYEKPDISGMGGQSLGPGSCFGVETTGVGGGVTDSTCGTSFSSPDVAALAALVIAKQPALRSNGEAVKAILMAGATHNIVEGFNYRDCPTSPVPGDCRDGAGGINAYQTINQIVVPGNWRFPGFITPASFNASGNIDYSVTIPAGRSIRLAMAWDSTATCSNLGTGSQACANDVLNADLDLHLIDPDGVLVAASSSFQNSAEVIDFTTTKTGTYTVRVRNFRFDAGTGTFLGVAWNLNAVTATPITPVSNAINFALNTTKNNQTTDKAQSFWDIYSNGGGATCFGANQTGLERVYKITTTQKGRITATLSNIVGYVGVNNDLDVIILKQQGGPATQNTKMVGCGDVSAVASNQSAGTYYVVVDGFAGSVARYSLRVNFTAGTTSLAAEEQTQRWVK